MPSTRKSVKQKQASSSKWMIWALAGAALVVVLAVIFVPGWLNGSKTGTSSETALPLEVNVSEARALMDEGAFLLDVREPAEWNSGHIEGATLIPLGELPGRLAEVPRDQKVVVVCRSGNRSAQGRDILLDAGFTQVTSMRGGVNDWQAQGYALVSQP